MRIRTIKPEFWVSESVGRLSRDARLLFIGLWSFADDSGRGRGALPAISGSLLPYDSDALKQLPRWLAELEREGMIRYYKGPDGNQYYDIPKWHNHQKIEKRSQARYPSFEESSPTTPPLVGEGSALDQGSGTRDQVTGKGTGTKDSPSVAEAVASPLPETSPMRLFTNSWTTSYEAFFKTPYLFQGAKDGTAASKLVKTGIPVCVLIDIARKAWANPGGFNSKQAVSIAGFAARFNEIRAENTQVEALPQPEKKPLSAYLHEVL